MHKMMISYDYPRIIKKDIRSCLKSISSQVSGRLIAIEWTWQKRSLPYVVHTHTHTHAHAQREREGGRERGKEREN